MPKEQLGLTCRLTGLYKSRWIGKHPTSRIFAPVRRYREIVRWRVASIVSIVGSVSKVGFGLLDSGRSK